MSSQRALVYRGPASCSGCAESVYALLKNSPSNLRVNYTGPNEAIQLTAANLNGVTIYAQPGGGSLSSGYQKMQQYETILKNYVQQSGGIYLGFCLGAYLAGTGPGFGLLPSPLNTDSEESQPGAEVRNTSDTMIRVNWTFATGSKKGTTATNRWTYFQDGSVFTPLNLNNLPSQGKAQVLGKYSVDGRNAAVLVKSGNGWLGLTGPHLEADQSWYDDYGMTNPDGIKFDLGYDLIAGALAKKASSAKMTRAETSMPTQASAAVVQSQCVGSTILLFLFALMFLL